MHVVGKMTESAPPRAKRSTPISCISGEERAKQFKDDLYAGGGVLFCKYCVHSVDYMRVDTIKDRLQRNVPTSRKKQRLGQ